jgi:mono/diheme cytochrome c family protein
MAGITAMLFIAMYTAGAAGNGDGFDPAAALEEHCTTCHNSTIFTRADHKMDSLIRLRKQVDNCQTDVMAEWTDEQIDAVVDYLNTQYYRFE